MWLMATYEELGDHRRAEALAINAAGTDPDLLAVLADTRHERGDRAGAERPYRHAAENGDEHGLHALGQIYEQDGERELALEWYDQAADAGNPNAEIGRVRMLEATGQTKEAWRRALEAANAQNDYALRALQKCRPEDHVLQHVVFFGLEPDGSPSQPWDIAALV